MHRGVVFIGGGVSDEGLGLAEEEVSNEGLGLAKEG